MIALHQSTIDAHPLMSQLRTPPTHALAVFKRYAHLPAGVVLPPAYEITIRDNTIEAIYAYGTVDAMGNFVPQTAVECVHAMVDLTGYTSPPCNLAADADKKAAAARNLLDPGVAPTPGAPHIPLVVPSKLNDFKECDLDAVVAFFDERLQGDVVGAVPPSFVTMELDGTIVPPADPGLTSAGTSAQAS